jgi:hypothetical protein
MDRKKGNLSTVSLWTTLTHYIPLQIWAGVEAAGLVLTLIVGGGHDQMTLSLNWKKAVSLTWHRIIPLSLSLSVNSSDGDICGDIKRRVRTALEANKMDWSMMSMINEDDCNGCQGTWGKSLPIWPFFALCHNCIALGDRTDCYPEEILMRAENANGAVLKLYSSSVVKRNVKQVYFTRLPTGCISLLFVPILFPSLIRKS